MHSVSELSGSSYSHSTLKSSCRSQARKSNIVLQLLSDDSQLSHSNPHDLGMILRFDPQARIKLVKYFLSMEKSTKCFVWNLVKSFCGCMTGSHRIGDRHLYGFDSSLKLGIILVEAGWYMEATVVLKTLKKLHEGKDIHQLRVLRTLLLAQSYSSRHNASEATISEIDQLLKGSKNDVTLDFIAEIYNNAAISYFEQCDFESSYYQGKFALKLLTEDSIDELTVSVLCQLAKTCIALKRFYLAKMCITQAVMMAYHKLGALSLDYAKALEDYAFFLLTMNAHADCAKVQWEAKKIYCSVYGPISLEPDLAQGNLPFRLYFESQLYSKNEPMENYVNFLVDLNEAERPEMGHWSEDRQVLAAKRSIVLETAAELAGVSNDTPMDGLFCLEPRLLIEQIKSLFLMFST